MSTAIPRPVTVFFTTWQEQTSSVPCIAPLRHTGDHTSAHFAALEAAEQLTLLYAIHDLNLSLREAAGLSGRLGQALVDWSRDDGKDRDALLSRLVAAAA